MLLVDSAPLIANRLICSQWAGLGIPGASIPSGGDQPAPLYARVQLPADADTEFRTEPVSVSAGLTVEWGDDASATVSAASAQAGSISYQIYANNSLLGTATDYYGFGGVAALVTADAAITLDGITLTADGSLAATGSNNGTASITLDDITASGAGSVAVQGGASLTLDGLTLTADGSNTAPGTSTGNASITLGDITASGAGGVAVQGVAQIDLAGVSLVARGGQQGSAPPIVLSPIAPRGGAYSNIQRATRRANIR